MKNILPAIVLAVLAGCATKSESTGVTSLGNGKYSVSNQAIITSTPRAQLRDMSNSQATTFCDGMGKKYNFVEQVDDPDGPAARWTEVKVIFTCV